MAILHLSKVWLLLHQFSRKSLLNWYYMEIFNINCHPNCLNNMECIGIQLTATLTYSMTVTDLILMKLVLVRQLFVKNSKTEFHEGLINITVAGITSQRDGQA